MDDRMGESPRQWSPCPIGVVKQLGCRLRSCRQRRQFLKASLGGGVAATAVVSGVAISPVLLGDPGHGHLTCLEVARCVPAYALHTLPSDLRKRVIEHVEHCEKCRPKFKSMGLTLS
ncbi:hypothetical protein Pan216_54020 [Planctomycetes bacterium Pan216]|uniref:Putative zinc-finger domain-containing protein n=1 Tax=Kolteria novifilia TaxID=2527975 RepID=A0A518BC10_9BACT|nr:hypothetical protein Pan216_54020 [Planctomycetes bacterium Pan216]